MGLKIFKLVIKSGLIIIVFLTFYWMGFLSYTQNSVCVDRPTEERNIPPESIWLEIGDTFLDEWPDADESFSTEVTFDFYISGVLLGELGSSPNGVTNADLPSNNGVWEDITLEAIVVAIRTFTWFRLNYAEQFIDPHHITVDNTNECGFWDYAKDGSGRQINAQVFRPYHREINQTVKDHYTTIVTQHVPDIYLVEGDGANPIDAQYRATVGEYSDPGGKPYLISVFDPISAGDPDPTNASGLGQWSAQRLAMGRNDAGDLFPKWVSYAQILFHFYTGVNLRRTNGALLTPPPAVDRFNIVQLENQPTLLRPGKTYQVPRITLQNTGANDWFVTELSDSSQTCLTSSTSLSHHLYQADLVDLACGDQLSGQGENPSGSPCYEGYRNPLCLVGQNALTPGQALQVEDVTLYLPPEADLQPGGYWLRWDMEFLHSDASDPFPPTWGSRLHLAPYTGEWFTQDKWVIVGKPNYSEVRNLHSPSHQALSWDNNPVIDLRWETPDDPIPTEYYRYRWQSDTGEVLTPDPRSWACEDWYCTDRLEIATHLSDAPDWVIELYSQATDGEINQPLQRGPFQIDTTPPTATLNALPQQITTSTYLLAWEGRDGPGSGIASYEITYQINGLGWQPVNGVGPAEITMTPFSFPEGQQGDVYTFCLVATDKLGYGSDSHCQTTRYTPFPQFGLSPSTIWRMQLESDPLPLTDTIYIQNVGGGVLTWTATSPLTWLTLHNQTGLAPSPLPLTFSTHLTTGHYSTVITFTGPPSTTNHPQVVSVTFKVLTDFYHQYLPIIIKYQSQ